MLNKLTKYYDFLIILIFIFIIKLGMTKYYVFIKNMTDKILDFLIILIFVFIIKLGMIKYYVIINKCLLLYYHIH